MAIDNIDKLKPIKAPAVKIRKQFNDIVQKYGALADGTATAGGYTSKSNIMFVGASEYNAGTTYVYNANNSINHTSTIYLVGNGSDGNCLPLSVTGKSSTSSIPSNATDSNQYNNLRGYLIPLKVSEYVSGGSVHITRGYASQLFGNYSGAAPTCLYDRTTGQPVDDLQKYADYYVPQITWYYEDNSGATKELLAPLVFWYFFTPSGARYKAGKKLLGGVVYDYGTHYNTEPAYFAFSPPYVINRAGRTVTRDDTPSYSAFTSGYIHALWSSPNDYTVRVTGANNAPYVILINAPSKSVSQLAPIDSAQNIDVPDIALGYPTSLVSPDTLPNKRPGRFPAYKTVQDIIDLFADYGVKLYLTLDEVQNPPPSEDGKINPDNPSEPIPYYPDNSTETTPIEQAYITPSTFGRACVYTPVTTKRFLNWVCDSTVDIGNWARLFANPVDVITGINLYNLDIVAHDSTHAAFNAQTNILGVTTDVPNYALLDGYNNIVNGGTLTLQAYYGNYADYTSMTYQMFIPFVGFASLRACDVVNKTLHLYYAVDFATGSAVAFVNSDNKLIYTSPCTVAGKIPLSTSDRNSQIINNTLSGIGAIGGLLGGIASGNVGGGVGALLNGLGGMQMQTNYTNKGSLSAVNMYKLLPAFIERTRYDLFFPSGEQQYLGAKYQGAAGAPSTQFDTLLNCVDAGGFVQSDVVYLTSQTATETEKQQIIDLIKSGIYL